MVSAEGHVDNSSFGRHVGFDMSMQSTYFLVVSMKIDFIDIYRPLQEAVLPGHYHLMSDHHRSQTTALFKNANIAVSRVSVGEGRPVKYTRRCGSAPCAI